MLDQEPMTRIAFTADAGASGTPSIPVGELPASSIFPADMAPSLITGVDNALIFDFLAR